MKWPWQRKAPGSDGWYEEQLHALKAGSPIQPPWIQFPGLEPFSFKQGVEEAWLLNVFLPFWRRLAPEERDIYLARWMPPPGTFWNEYLTEIWNKRLPGS